MLQEEEFLREIAVEEAQNQKLTPSEGSCCSEMYYERDPEVLTVKSDGTGVEESKFLNVNNRLSYKVGTPSVYFKEKRTKAAAVS